MRALTIILILLFVHAAQAQLCDDFFDPQRLTDMVSPTLILEGRGEYYPCFQLKVFASKSGNDALQIMVRGDDCAQRFDEDGRLVGPKAITTDQKSLQGPKALTEIVFTFADGEAFHVFNESNRLESNSIFINKNNNSSLFTYFKTQLLRKVKVVCELVNAEYDLPQLNAGDPKSNQAFFVNLFRCLELSRQRR